MVIMSDIENFMLKFTCVVFGLFGLVMSVLYARETWKTPEVVYKEPETVVETDTVFVHDTIYRFHPSVQTAETTVAPSDTERSAQ